MAVASTAPRPARANPEHRIQRGECPRRPNERRRQQRGNRGDRGGNPERQSKNTTQRRAPRGNAGEQHGDRGEEHRHLPRQPEPGGHTTGWELDTAGQITQGNRADARNQQDAHNRHRAIPNPQPRAERGEQRHEHQRA